MRVAESSTAREFDHQAPAGRHLMDALANKVSSVGEFELAGGPGLTFFAASRRVTQPVEGRRGNLEGKVVTRFDLDCLREAAPETSGAARIRLKLAPPENDGGHRFSDFDGGWRRRPREKKRWS